MGRDHRVRHTPEQCQQAADLIGAGVPISSALVQAGWSQATANKGVAALPNAVLKLMPKKAKELIALGKSTSQDDIKHMVSGRLVENVQRGKDSAVQSAKLLGSRNDLNMWMPDMQLGVIVLQAPQSAIDRKAELLAGLLAPDEE